MKFRHNVDEGVFIVLEQVNNSSAWFAKDGVDERTGKINPIKPEARMVKYYFSEMRPA